MSKIRVFGSGKGTKKPRFSQTEALFKFKISDLIAYLIIFTHSNCLFVTMLIFILKYCVLLFNFYDVTKLIFLF
jgi:hypothetical protein